MKRFYIYVLARPDGSPFYVGKGSKNRVHRHDTEARSGHKCHKCNVIRKIWRQGTDVQRYIVFETDDEPEAFAYERELIALHGRDNLTNVTDGGPGITGYNMTALEIEKRRLRSKERMNIPQWKEWARNRLLERWRDPGYQAARSDQVRRQWEDTDSAIRASVQAPGVRAKHSSNSKQSWQDPDYRAKVLSAVEESYKRPGVLEARNAAIRAAKQTPEARAKASAGSKEAWARRKAAQETQHDDA